VLVDEILNRFEGPRTPSQTPDLPSADLPEVGTTNVQVVGLPRS
jgi:hypothetical protein